MSWDVFALEWLARAAAGGFILLAAAAVAVRCCRQPADRVRIIGLALPGALLIPWVALIPGLPRWDLAVLPAERVSQALVTTPEPPPSQADHASQFVPMTVPETLNETILADTTPQPAPSAAFTSEHTKTGTISVSQLSVTPEPTAAGDTVPVWTAAQVVVCAYALLSALALIWVSVGLWRLYLLWRTARPAPADLIALLREIGGPAADGVQLLVSPRLDSPVAFGGWRPIILLPESALNSDGHGAIRYGLAHEWSHVERGDVWRWHLVTLAQLFLFYQPLFWWLRRQLRLGQDFLADARATDQTADPIEYAQYLVSLARRRMGVPGLVLGITDRRSNLTRRVHMLLLNRTPLSRRCRLAWTCGAALLAIGLMTGTAAVRLARAEPALPAEPRDDKKADEKKPAAAPEKGETLNYSGVVKNKETGKLLAGATVTVRRSILGDPERPDINPVVEETKHTTNAEGKYSFTIPPEQTAQRYLYIELDVEHPDCAPQKGFGYALSMIRKNEKLGGRPFFESVELRPAKPVTGVVKTPDGQPAAGVKVMAYSVTSKKPQGTFEYGSFADTRTDADGQFCLSLVSPGWAVVWVLPEKFVPTTHVVKDKRGHLGTFTLQAGPRLRGTLLDAKGKPLSGVIVNADSRDRNEEITEPVTDYIRRSAVTNEKGEFELNPLPPGNYLVKPGAHAEDGSIDRNSIKPRSVPAVFVGTKVIIKAGADPEKLEVRAVPHVAIEAQYLDSKGKPTRGHSAHIFGEIDGVPWFGESKVTPDGKMVALVPHGLERVQFNMTTNEHGVLRWRKTKDEPLNNSRTAMLGTLTDDVKGIEIIRYTAPILLVKVTTKDGSKPADLTVSAHYPKGKARNNGFIIAGDRTSDVHFEQQEDGKFRSSQLLPNEEVTVTGHAEGYVGASQKVKLDEETTKQIEIVLEKTAEKKDGEKK